MNIRKPLPCIGEVWQDEGGVFAGLARGINGAPDYCVIVGPEMPERRKWDLAIAFAQGIDIDGKSDYALPTRKEQALMFANVPELFKGEIYWSCEQHAADRDYVWGRGFGDGLQGYWTKDYEFCACAVRRLFTPLGFAY